MKTMIAHIVDRQNRVVWKLLLNFHVPLDDLILLGVFLGAGNDRRREKGLQRCRKTGFDFAHSLSRLESAHEGGIQLAGITEDICSFGLSDIVAGDGKALRVGGRLRKDIEHGDREGVEEDASSTAHHGHPMEKFR